MMTNTIYSWAGCSRGSFGMSWNQNGRARGGTTGCGTRTTGAIGTPSYSIGLFGIHVNANIFRHCIYPEVSRTFNFGRRGVSGGLFYEQHIGRIVLNPAPVSFTGFRGARLTSYRVQPRTRPFASLDVSNHQTAAPMVDVRWFLPDEYDAVFLRSVYEHSTPTDTAALRRLLDSDQPHADPLYVQNRNLKPLESSPPDSQNADNDAGSRVIDPCGPRCYRSYVIYYQPGDYTAGKNGLGAQVRLLEQWQLMDDIREDVARVSYRGVVVFKQRMRVVDEWVRVYIAPERKP